MKKISLLVVTIILIRSMLQIIVISIMQNLEQNKSKLPYWDTYSTHKLLANQPQNLQPTAEKDIYYNKDKSRMNVI